MKSVMVYLLVLICCAACVPTAREWTRDGFNEQTFQSDLANCQQEAEDNIPRLTSEEISKQGLSADEASDAQNRRSLQVYEYSNSSKGYMRT
jgi:hypothetical protein